MMAPILASLFDGRTAGRAFENAFTPYFYGGIAIISIAAWVWFHFDIKKHAKKSNSDQQGKK